MDNPQKPSAPWVLRALRKAPWLGLVVLALVAGGVLLVPWTGKPLVPLVTQERSAWSITMLEEARDLLRFNTVQYVYKVVFPFDFTKDSVELDAILNRVGQAQGRTFNLVDLPKVLTDYRELLTLEELAHLEALEIAKAVRLSFTRPQYQFVVASVVVEAGVDFALSPLGNPGSADPEALAQVVQTSESRDAQGNLTRSITLRVPAPRVTEVRIEDRETQGTDMPYPNVNLTPSGWQRIATFIEGYYQERALSEGVLVDAQTNAEAFLVALFQGAGFTEVHIDFTYEP